MTSSKPNITSENASASLDGGIANIVKEYLSSMKENLKNTSVQNIRNMNSKEDRQQRIATAAYYRAEQRGFNSGHEIQDWLEAEKDMDMETILPIKIDMTETDQDYIVRAQIPGVKKEDVKILVDGDLVSISAEVKQEKEEKEGERIIYRECCQGTSYRSFTLERSVDEAKVQAKCENGMLVLILPKRNGVMIEIK